MFQDNLSNFLSNSQPFDFHISNSHSAIDYVGSNSSNYPVYDIDGDIRSGDIDVGADEYTATTGINLLDNNSEFRIFPNPISFERSIQIEGNQNITSIIIFNSNGQQIFNKELNTESNIVTLDLPISKSGLYFLQINNSTSIPFIINQEN